MKHILNLIIKYLMVSVILFIILNYLTNLRTNQILFVSVLVTIPAYLLGDLLILKRSNNTIAVLADMGLTFVVLYLSNYLMMLSHNFANIYGYISIMDALVASLAVGIGEWFYHKYVVKTDRTLHS